MLICVKRKVAITGSTDGLVKVFDLPSFKLFKSINAENEDVSLLTCDQNEIYLAFCDQKQIIYIYNLIYFTRIAKIEFEKQVEIHSLTLLNPDYLSGQACLLIATKMHGVTFLTENFFVAGEKTERSSTRTYRQSINKMEANYQLGVQARLPFKIHRLCPDFKLPSHINRIDSFKDDHRHNAFVNEPYDLFSFEAEDLSKEGDSNPQNDTHTSKMITEDESYKENRQTIESILNTKSRRFNTTVNGTSHNPIDCDYAEGKTSAQKKTSPIKSCSKNSLSTCLSLILPNFNNHSRGPSPFTTINTCEYLQFKNIVLAMTESGQIFEWDMSANSLHRNRALSASMAHINDNNKYENFDVVKDTDIFLFCSKNMHAFFVREDDRQYNKIYEEKYKKINSNNRERAQTLNSNSDYSVIAINIVEKGNKENSEALPLKTELFFYKNSPPKSIQLLHHLDETVIKVNLKNNIFIIESSPTEKSIFVTGDSEGQVIVWNVERAQVLYIFQETCEHIESPLISNPIVDLKFLPNGVEFITSSFYGSISLYSLGCGDNYAIHPSEQFLTTDVFEEEQNDQALMLLETNPANENVEEAVNGSLNRTITVDNSAIFINDSSYTGNSQSSRPSHSDARQTASTDQSIEVEKRYLRQLQNRATYGKLCDSSLIAYPAYPCNDKIAVDQFVLAKLKKISEKSQEMQMVEPIHKSEFNSAINEICELIVSNLGFGPEVTSKINSNILNYEALNFALYNQQVAPTDFFKTATPNGDFKALDQTAQATDPIIEEFNEEKTNFQRRKRKQDFVMHEESEEEFSEHEEEAVHRPHSRRLKRKISDYESEEEFSRAQFANRRQRNGRMDYLLEEEESVQSSKPQKSRRPDRGEKAEMAAKVNSDSRLAKQLATCFFCGSPNAIFKCKSCDISFDQNCQKTFCVQYLNLGSQCLDCFFIHSKHAFNSKKPNLTYLLNCNRKFYDLNTDFEFDLDINFYRFVPQLNDEFFFIPSIFLNFVQYFKAILPAGPMIGTINQLALLKSDHLVKILDYSFEFPQIQNRADYQKFENGPKENELYIFQALKLKFASVNAVKDLGLSDVLTVNFCFPANLDLLFLIPKGLYKFCESQMKKIDATSLVTFDSKTCIIKKLSKDKQTLANAFELVDLNGKMDSRFKKDTDSTLKAHPWLVQECRQEFIQPKPEIDFKLIKSTILKITKRNLRSFEYFYSEVPKDEYGAYPSYVPIEMNLEKILERLENSFYTSIEQLAKDIQQIEENANLFNQSDSEICEMAHDAVQILMKGISRLINLPNEEEDIVEKNEQEELEASVPGKRKSNGDLPEEESLQFRKRRKEY